MQYVSTQELFPKYLRKIHRLFLLLPLSLSKILLWK
nr:MAG TPA: hypothetical protein [Bacteriophage sp.]